MERKAVAFEFKAETEGAFRAMFSKFGVVDLDKDVTLKGAFETGAPVRVAQWAHNWGQPTIGGGKIGASSEGAWADAQFNLKMSAGRETYESVKFDAETIKQQQWSYAYDVLEESHDPKELLAWPGAQRILKKLKVHEVSPVLLGAGPETATEFIKALSLQDQEMLAKVANATLTVHWKDLAAELTKSGRAISGARRERIARVVEAARSSAGAATAAADELEALLAETQPEDPEKARIASERLRSDFLRLRVLNQQLGVNA